MLDIIGLLKNLFGMGEAVTRQVTQKDAQLNTPKMQQNAEAQVITKAHQESVSQVQEELKQAEQEQKQRNAQRK